MSTTGMVPSDQPRDGRHDGISIREEGEERSQIAKQRCQMGERKTRRHVNAPPGVTYQPHPESARFLLPPLSRLSSAHDTKGRVQSILFYF
jgi:hypothetical protein